MVLDHLALTRRSAGFSVSKIGGQAPGRGLAMRTDKHAHNYEAGLLLGAIVMWTPT